MSTNDFSQALPVGAVLHGGKYDYTIESVLGKGGFGFTYLVSTYVKIENIDVKLFFAVKEHFVSSLSSRLADSGSVESSQPVKVQVEGSLKDFRSEAKRLKTLSGKSPYIVKVNESFDANNTAYYVMEYIDGQSLNDVIKTSGPVEESQALAWIKAVTEAVGTVHEARMTHLDIKPANILLAHTSNGDLRPVLIDFGLAKHYDSSGNATSTLNTVGCSDGYAPIEQYGGLKTFSPTADIYALGATLFSMLTGTKPPTASDVDREVLDSELKQHGVSDGVRKAVLKAMEYKAGQRFQSVAEFDKALDDAAGGIVELEVVTDDGEETRIKDDHNNRAAKPRKINWKLILTVAGIIIVGGLVWLLIDRSDSKSGTVVPDPEYDGYGYDEVEAAVEEVSEYDILLYKIRRCTSIDELQQLASDYSDFVSGLPKYEIDALENAASKKMSELAEEYYYTDDTDYDYGDSAVAVEDYYEVVAE